MAIKTETIVTRYEVHTISHEQGVDRIRQKQKQLELQLKDWNEEAKRMEGVHAAAWKKVGLAIAGVTVAIAAGVKAVQHYAKEQRLTAAAGTADIGRLEKAAGGLQTRFELLEFAAKANHGAIKLSTSQMVIAQEAMRELTREGHAQEDVTKKVTDAIVKLEDGGLKDFGIRVREAKGETDKFNAIMEALAGKARAADGAVNTEADSIQQLGVRFANASDRIKNSVGQVVIAMTPLIESVATLAEHSAGLVDRITEGWDLVVSSGRYLATGDESIREQLFLRLGGDPADLTGRTDGSQYEEFLAAGGTQQNYLSALMSQTLSENASDPLHRPAPASSDFAGMIGQGVAAFNMLAYRGVGAANNRLGKFAERFKTSTEAAKARREELRQLANSEAKRLTDDLLARLEAEATSVTDGSAGPALPGGVVYEAPDAQELLGSTRALLDSFYAPGGGFDQQQAQGYELFRAEKQKTFLEGTFGPLTEFDAYKTAFDSLSGAVGASLSAWIDGSASAGEAFKAFIGEAVKGLAVQMAMESLKHGAYALGSLAFGDIRGAATHGKAALAFGLGAAAAAAAAKGLSSGGAGASAGASAGGGGRSAAPTYGAGTAPSNQNITIITGDSFSDDTPRNRALRSRKVVRKALGSSGVVYE